MKIAILTFATLTLFTTATFAESKVDVPSKEAHQIFKVAGFTKTKQGWEGGCGTGEITIYKDLNSDGLKDAVIQDGNYTCYGNTGVGYHIVTQ